MPDLFTGKRLSKRLLLLYSKLCTHLKAPDSLHVHTSNSNDIEEEGTPKSFQRNISHRRI